MKGVAYNSCTVHFKLWAALLCTVQLEWVNGRWYYFRANNSKTFLAYGVQFHKFWNNKREDGRCRGSLDFTTFTADLRIVEPFGA